MTVMRRYAQDMVNQEESEQNEIDGMKKGAVGLYGVRQGFKVSDVLLVAFNCCCMFVVTLCS